MSIIKDFYGGKICPVESIFPQDTKYRPLSNEIGKERDYFASKLPPEDKERFQKWHNLLCECDEMTEYANFSYGFRMGAMLICEIFTGEENV